MCSTPGVVFVSSQAQANSVLRSLFLLHHFGDPRPGSMIFHYILEPNLRRSDENVASGRPRTRRGKKKRSQFGSASFDTI
jgi:hypothetical protein